MHHLLLLWKDRNGKKHHIGNLTYDGRIYRFFYEKESLDAALASGYLLHPSFPDKDKVYESTRLFAPFARRLPDRRRPDYLDITSRLGLSPDVSDMDMLAATGGKLATDSYEFVPKEGITMNQKRCDYCGEFKDQLRATPFLADAGLSMCKECWDITREAVGDIGEFE